MSAMPVSKKGGTCVSDTPSEAKEAHSAMAPRAYALAWRLEAWGWDGGAEGMARL